MLTAKPFSHTTRALLLVKGFAATVTTLGHSISLVSFSCNTLPTYPEYNIQNMNSNQKFTALSLTLLSMLPTDHTFREPLTDREIMLLSTHKDTLK
jgi:hypothetical protein